ncbi:polyketide synthase [Pseudomonas sp. Os17]|uniref:beta-ketoacyl synthase N-terminal-like domain-containing protein n=1 Tax=Pseudomonas sp. Os17 TaxID=1500686 RepID=UPI0005FCA880|nr:beta-ketoacyl synthase N-terminal-like domain-containing protein [Pseudomonas sp. Os17]BAQ74672.1 polyketide synthase [Pseudomonas sp. Os17]
MEKPLHPSFTDQLFFIATVLSLESRQLISRRGINRPFGFAPFVAAASINDGPLRVAFDGLKAFGWLSQPAEDEYFFSGRASAIGTLPMEVAELFSRLAPQQLPRTEDMPGLWRCLECAALDWNLHCPAFVQGLNQLLALVLLHRLQLNGGLDLGTGRVDPRRIDVQQSDAEGSRRLSDFLRSQQWVRREERHLVLNPERRALLAERLSAPFLEYYASLPAILDDLLFSQGQPWTEVLHWLEGAGASLLWPGDRPALEQLLGKVFDAQPLSAQPDWIVQLGDQDGTCLNELRQWLRQHTARGRALDSYPLQWLTLEHAVPGDPSALRQRLRDAGVGADARILWLGIGQLNRRAPQPSSPPATAQAPSRFYLGADGQPLTGAQVLGSLDASAHALASLIGDQPILLSERHWRPNGPRADHFACDYPVEAAQYLMALAGAGLFADPGSLHPRPLDGIDCEASSGCYRARDYRVRPVTLADMPALLALEQACWPEGGRVDAAILRRRLSQDPAGQLALEFQGALVGVIYSQRIARIEELFAVNFATVDQLFHGQGSTVQIQSLNILPEHQYSGYGDQLLEFMLQYCTLRNGVDTVVGVTRCKDYPKHRHLAQADYLHGRDERGVLLDPVLRFHELHGARIERLVPGYRPADADNHGHGVLVRYDLASRQRQELTPPPTLAATPTLAIDEAVRQGVNRCLGLALDSRVSPRHSLMELGLDSADLLALSEQLAMTLGLVLEPSFFFRYNHFEKIVAALQERLASPQGTAPIATQATQAATSEPTPASAEHALAVIGISGAFPGGDLEGFWAAIGDGVSQLRPIPPERAMDGPPGGYLDGIEYFDHGFFGLSPAEAALMDPQQRLLLQHAWWALEDAAISAPEFARHPTGVFIAAAPSEYRDLVEAPQASPFRLTSSAPCMYANRISWFLDLRGPSEYCNSACSSALVALHRAMQAIRAGECRQALVGAVNLLLSPAETAGYRQMGLLSEQAQTRSFQAGADGYVRSEGVGVLLLKPLADALRDGDRIHLKIIGSGVGHGGRGLSLTAPDHHGMQAAMVAAYRAAGVAPHTVSHVEAHGTGSTMGDAIEVDAIQAARRLLSGDAPAGAPWNISSLKPLIGHCELASGMAALFKVIDAMKRQHLPGIPGYRQLSPTISVDPQLLAFEAENRPWPALRDAQGEPLPRRASINSYGFGGVNAHLVVEEVVARPREAVAAVGPQLILLSALDGQRLRAQARRLSQAIDQRPELSLADIAHTLQVGRTALQCRWACVVDSRACLQQRLDELALGVGDELLPVAEPAPEDAAAVARALADRDWPTLADAWRQGANLDWRTLRRLDQPQRVSLPGYAFAQERHWLAPRQAQAQTLKQACPSQNSPRQVLAEVLGCDPQTLAGCASRSLASLGLNSLGALGLKARLEQELHLSLSLAQLSPYLSLAEVEASLSALPRHDEAAQGPLLQPAPEAAQEPFALNDIQQSFLSGRQLLPEAERVGCHIYLEFDWPNLDLYRLNQAWNRLVLHHDALRLRLLEDGRQQVTPGAGYRFKTRDLRRSTAEERERTLADLRAAMSLKVYHVGQDRLFEVAVSLLDRQVSRVHLSIDELIVDATSLEVLLQQWLMIYQDPAAGLPDLGVTFRDYQQALEAFKDSPRYRRDLQYWLDKLARAPAGLLLPKASRPAGRERRRLAWSLERHRWQRLKEQGAALQVSGTALLLGLFGLILQQANAGQGFSLICTSYGRFPLHPGIERLVGPLISTQFFAFAAAGDANLADWTQGVQRQLLEDLDHASVGGVAALREVRRRGASSVPLCSGEVVFTSMLNNPLIDSAPSFGDAQHYCVTQTPQVNLDHQMREQGGALNFSWDVAIDCYPDGLIEQLFADYCRLLVSLADADADWRGVSASGLPPAAPFHLTPAAAPAQPFALTDQQQAYAFSRALHRGQGSSHLYLAVSIEALDVSRLARAWQQLVARHPMLRTRILPNGTQQTLETVPEVPLETLEQGVSCARIADAMLGRVTALGDWPHAELKVSRLDEAHSLVHLGVDLLLVDLPSRDLLIRQLLALYHGQSLPALTLHFADYIEALGQYQRSPAARDAALYWQEKFRRLPQGPQVHERQDGHGPYLEYEYRLDSWPALRERLQRAAVSADALLISAYAWSLAKHGATPGFTLVAPGWTRPPVHPQIDTLVGDFTTLSWIDFDSEPLTLLEQARRCDRIFSEDQQRSGTSGLQALRKMATDKQRPRKLDFPVVFTRLNPQGALDLPAGARLVKGASRTHGVALDNLGIETRETLLIHWDLAADRLAPERVEAMFGDYCRLLERLAVDEGGWAWTGIDSGS